MSRIRGVLSTIERLSHYVEWQAMMCAVGEMVVEVPLAPSYDDANAALNEWIDRNLATHITTILGSAPLSTLPAG